MNPRSHTERDEVCPVSGCWDQYGDGEALCPTHWGALYSYWRAEIRRAQEVIRDAAPGPARISARMACEEIVGKAVESLEEVAA